MIPFFQLSNLLSVHQCESLTLSGGVQFVEPLKDIRDHEGRGPRGAVLSGDVGLLSEARGHVVHNGDDDAQGLLGHRHTLSQLQLQGTTDTGSGCFK